MAGIRQERIGALLQRELGTFLQRESSIRYGGHFITVTTVRLTPDLSLARVYLSFLPVASAGTPEAGLELVQEDGYHIRKTLAGQVGKHLRKMPELRFYLDDGLDRYEEIDRLLTDD